jgi:hypothetical protein
VYGPPIVIGGSTAVKLPASSAVVTVWLSPSETETDAPGAALPEMGRFLPRGRTAPELNIFFRKRFFCITNSLIVK